MKHEHLQAVTEQSFEADVLGSPLPVLVEFTAAWCSPCRALTPIMERLARENAGRVKVCVVEGDEQPALAVRLGVRGFPTVIAFVGGREVARNAGLTSKEKLLRLVERA